MQENQILDALTREGVLINVSVRYWRGCKKLQPEDIGLKPDQLSDKLISLGQKRLLPKEALAGLSLIESRAHSLVEQNTFPFLHGLGHFLPNTKLEEVTAKLASLEGEFWQEKEQFIQRYDQLRDQAIGEWETMAEKLAENPEQLVVKIEQAFPLSLKKFFGFEVQLFQVALPERLHVDLVGLEDQRQIIQARQQAAQAAGFKIQRGVEAFVADCVASLREQTGQLCEDMLHSIETNEIGVHQKTLNRLVNFIGQFKQMNFANDQEMERQLEGVRRELLNRTAVEYRDNPQAKNQLVNGLANLRDKARELANQEATELVQRFGSIGRRKFHLAA